MTGTRARSAARQDDDVIEVGGERFYTAAGAAKVLHLNEQTVRRYFRGGVLNGARPHGKVIYFSEADLKAFLSGL